MFRSIRRNFDYNLRIFLFGSFHRIAETFFDFFFFFCFQHFSNSIRLSLLNYLSRILFAATVYETCASHVPFVRPAPTFFEIFYSIENGILIRALSSPLPRIVSIQVWEASYFNATVLRAYSTLPLRPFERSFASRTKRRNVEAAGSDRWVGRNRGFGAKEGCARA